MNGERLRIANAALTVQVSPANGADIVSIVDRRTGIDIMSRTPWAASPESVVVTDSESRWLSQYGGGWQVLFPNAGPERIVDAAVWGFHGEAALLAWTVESRRPDRVRLAVDLGCAPLRIERELRLAGPTVQVAETVVNTGGYPIEVMWVHHITFGEPLIGDTCRLTTSARAFISDDVAPGTELPPDQTFPWPVEELASLEPRGPKEVSGCLTDFDEGRFRLANAAIDLDVEVRWDVTVFPHAWLWEEFNAISAQPWYGRARIVGVEPATSIPWTGIGGTPQGKRGRGIQLEPGEPRSTYLALTVGRHQSL